MRPPDCLRKCHSDRIDAPRTFRQTGQRRFVPQVGQRRTVRTGTHRRAPARALRDAGLLVADLRARWCPVVKTAGVVGELDGPPPPTVVLGMMPLLENSYLAAGEQHGQAIKLLSRPHLAASQRQPIE